ncbi:MAG: hypothetical protein AB7H96_13755 [Vicinamibacterales bacterium]
MSAWRRHAPGALLVATLTLVSPPLLRAQSPAPATSEQPSPSLEALVAEIRRLQAAIAALQTELAASKRETASVQQALQDLREELQEERDLLAAQVTTLEQSKVESGSKYRVRLFGMALMQLVSTRGGVDNIDLPLLAIETAPGDSGGAISAAVRQSYIGLAVFGPNVRGFDTSGDLRLDFFGGFPDANDGLSAPGVRLRTMQIAAEGARTSIRLGQEAPFFSPLSPSSLSSTAYPALSSSGNIWSWVPQVYAERRYARERDTTLSLRVGVLDALTGELPAGEYSRLPTAGERSRMPAYAVRGGWRRGTGERVASAGAGGYYSRHNWGYNRNVNSWAITGDGEVPLSRTLRFSGEVYTGVAIGGLGGGAHSSVLFAGSPDDPGATVFPLHSVGGWAQLKMKSTPRLEFNLAAGGDRSLPRNYDGLLQPPREEAPSASRNASGLLNAIYQLRSNLFLTVEYRRLWTTRLDGRSWAGDHVSIGGGIAF